MKNEVFNCARTTNFSLICCRTAHVKFLAYEDIKLSWRKQMLSIELLIRGSCSSLIHHIYYV